ncbi:MAG: FAD-binding oxidoreductase [Clostridia bacterium]|nr:FAD-binding oxidoreductase [Deltaproteobacteria bacterium]
MTFPTPATWQAQVKQTRFARLGEDIETDVVVIGAGLTGLVTAARLVRSGNSVVVMERSRVGSGTSGYTTAHVTALLDSSYHAIQSKFGKDAAKLVARAMTEAIDELEQLAQSCCKPRSRRTDLMS